MGRRRRGWQRCTLVVLTLAGLFLAAPTPSSGGKEHDLRLRPSCPGRAAELGDGDGIQGKGTPNGMSGDCIGAPLPCVEYQAY